MYCMYQDREELDNDLYQEDEGDSEGSEVNSELEFHLYSQLHYSSNAGETEEQEDGGQKVERQQLDVSQRTADVDGEQEPPGESRPTSPDVSELLQHLRRKKKKKNGEKPEKQKKSRSKGQRSSYFEEVIVIDSSPDVISISEDDDDDGDGVCASKGRILKQLQTSTPAQQGAQKRGLGIPVTVVSSSSESDIEESETDSSDSDGLETWMILGRGNQEGDRSISLNLEGGSDGSEDAEEEEGGWIVSAKDKEAQICNKDKGARATTQRLPHRYYTDKNVHCRNCNRTGHLSKNCPEPKKSSCFLCGTQGHMSSDCPNRHCNNCGLPGHLFNSCSERAHWHKQCERCGMRGHSDDACPEIWRQYHITTKKGPPVRQQNGDRSRTPAYCYNCSKKGHFGHECKCQRMFNGTYPGNPFINQYDTKKEIIRRQNWLKSKVKDLKRNGLFPTSGSQAPPTPGPPKKKQKISHYKNNYQSHHAPRQSHNSHKPKHIFFNDDYNFETAPKRKHKKDKQQERTGNAKPWKPKRPVPTSKDLPPPSKIMLDEAEDFPRGRGGKGGDAEKKRKGKRKNVPLDGRRQDRLFGTISGDLHGSASRPQRGKRNWRSRDRKNDKRHAAQMYPTDENLFIIKQRKRSR